ncbi:hypothetical protein [Actinophytocola algeriensis]|uniref:Uncharacterized protein n=1 Tax=Actinophytocola algeriensis TaxID=1768010 RepID=A0A7W7Q2B2_9PSEU|nr:hypothetical protein [Actinophytocola algeriensis]MBB4905508.1 hypothetical protein [Actinophytocola algeriensis]MBE1472807.1 hypothetical protein [Actinophytocola algeriensis]
MSAWERHEVRHPDGRRLTADLRVVDTLSRRDAAESTLARFVVEDGRPGVRVI